MVSHKLHESEGVEPRGARQGVCHDGQCDFLIAVAVKSFDSGDSNRDLHMVQVTRGAEFPIVTVRTRLPESAASSATVNADLEIQFAGQTAQYKKVPFKVETQGGETHITGTIPATLTDFQDRPTVAVDDAGQERDSSAGGYDLAFAVNAGFAGLGKFPRSCFLHPSGGVKSWTGGNLRCDCWW